MNGPPWATLAEFLGDTVVYRSLDPLDPRLPRYAEMAPRVGLPLDVTPRKGQPEYARAVAELLRAAARLRGVEPIERILFVGDTRGNDATAFHRLCLEAGWPGIGFIGRDEVSVPASWDLREESDRVLLFASRWRLLDALDAFCDDHRFPIDGRMAVIVDIDKTAIGARGRNDGAIDRARIDALRRTLLELLGDVPPWDACRRLYERLNRPSLHRLTADNQDIIATLCLLIVAGAMSPEILDEEGGLDRLEDLSALLTEACDGRRLPPSAWDVWRRFREGVRRAAPPEFDAFRRNEFAATVERMGLLPDGAGREERLAKEITITAEVRCAALRWRERGALLLGLSDKPVAASLPTKAMAAAGCRPLHRTEGRVVGGLD